MYAFEIIGFYFILSFVTNSLLKYLNAVATDQMMCSLMQGANMDVFCVTNDYQVTGSLLLMFISCLNP